MARKTGKHLRRGQAGTDCLQCLEIAARLVEALIPWEGLTHNYNGLIAFAGNLRVSCEATLAGKRLCPAVGYERNNERLSMEINFGEHGIEDVIARHTGGMV